MDQFVLEVVRQWYSIPFVKSQPLALAPVEALLPRLQFKLEDLWEKVLSLNGVGSISKCHRTRGGGYPHYFLATKCTDGFCPILILSELNTNLRTFVQFCMDTLSSILQSSTGGGGWCCWISRTSICIFQSTQECKNGLAFKKGFSIDALIDVTLVVSSICPLSARMSHVSLHQ